MTISERQFIIQALPVREGVLRPRKWEWSSFLVGLVLTGATGWLAWFGGWQRREYSWGWIVLIVVGFLAFAFFFSTVNAARASTEDQDSHG